MLKRIGVDIDGVITDESNRPWRKVLEEYFALDGPLNPCAYDFMEAYGLTREQLEDFYLTKGEEIISGLPPWIEARKTIKKLKSIGIQISLITARPPRFRKITEEWLKRHDIPFDNLIHDHNKAEVCRELNIELFIEDNLENALGVLEQGIFVILVDKPYNQGEYSRLIRVKGWNEIERIINNLLDNGKPNNRIKEMEEILCPERKKYGILERG